MLIGRPLFRVQNLNQLTKLVKSFKSNSFVFEFPENVHEMWKTMIKKILVY